MKKYILQFALFVIGVLFLFPSCAYDSMENGGGPSSFFKIIFTADTREQYYSDRNTKTLLTSDTIILWQKEDQIAIYSGQEYNYKSIYSTQDETGRAVFTKLPGESNPVSFPVIALYPAQFAKSISSEGQLTLTLPSTQTYSPNSFGNTSYPMVAVSNNTILKFYNLCAVLHLKLVGDKSVVQSITISSPDIISGEGTVDLSDAKKPLLTMTKGSHEVTLDCGKGVTLNADFTSFYIAIPPSSAQNRYFGVTIRYENGTTYGRATINHAANEFKRCKVKTMDTQEPDKEWLSNPYIYKGVSYQSGISVNGVVWAPVNCGYEPVQGDDPGYTYGKMYQEGRRFGQGYNGDRTWPTTDNNNLVVGPVDFLVGNMPENEDVFFTTTNQEHEWAVDHEAYKTNWNSNWTSDGGDANPAKTIYDPCPWGWRVPTETEFSTLVNASNSWTTTGTHGSSTGLKGRVFGTSPNSVFFPAAGARPANGLIGFDLRDNYGFYWSSTPSVTSDAIGDLFIYDSGAAIDESHEVTCAYAFSVRCVKE